MGFFFFFETKCLWNKVLSFLLKIVVSRGWKCFVHVLKNDFLRKVVWRRIWRRAELPFALVSGEPATVVRSRSWMEVFFWWLGGWVVQERRCTADTAPPHLCKPQQLYSKKKKAVSYLNSSYFLSSLKPTPKTSGEMQVEFILTIHTCGKNTPAFWLKT